MRTGNGKIANLPAKIRDELNWRINDGDEGKELVEWLNAKPEVLDVVTRLFDGKPISQQNLSQWRTHGYRQWHVHHTIVQEMMALGSNSGDFQATGVDCEKLVLALTANYAEMIQRWIITPPEQMTYRMEVFKNLTREVLGLRHSEFRKKHLSIQERRLELSEEKAGKSKSVAGSRASLSTNAPSDEVFEPVPQPRDPEPVPPRDPELIEVVEAAESAASSQLTEAGILAPVAEGHRIESNDCAPPIDAAVAGLSEAGPRSVDSEKCLEATPSEPSHQITAPSTSELPTVPQSRDPELAEVAGSPEPVPQSRDPEPVKGVESAEVACPARLSGEVLVVPQSRAVAGERAESVVEVTQAIPAEVSPLADPDQPDGKAPDSISECTIGPHDDNCPKASPQTALNVPPAVASTPTAPPPFGHLQFHLRRGHRQDRPRRESNAGQIPVSPPATKSATNPVTAPQNLEADAVTSSSPPPATQPPPAATKAVPFWPSRRTGGPPRNASPQNRFGLL